MEKNLKGLTRRKSLKLPHAYEPPPQRRLQKIKFSGPEPAALTVEAIEVCQSVQDDNNKVALIAGKATLVRVYLDQKGVAKGASIRGELTWRRGDGATTYLPAINELRVNPKDTSLIQDKREKLEASLNFRLPKEATLAGPLTVEVNRLTQRGGDDQPIAGIRTINLDFKEAPELRIRCIGLRYRDAKGQTFTPDATHFAYLRSFLERAYPVPSVIWSHIVVDADFSAPFNDETVVLANMQVAAIRSTEVSAGTDPRTHYYGLVDDGNRKNFMRGRAMGIPSSPQPDVVASGPCGIPNGFTGDTDLSYADWYGAHELGHTFGRYHPGFPPGSQDASDPNFPYDNGQLSKSDRKYVGYDLGDEQLGILMRALPGTIYHDIMTYADRQWVSAYSFEAIRLRLLAENALFGGVPPPVA